MSDRQPTAQVTVMIPQPLRQYTDECAEVCVQAGTVAEVLYQLVERYGDIGRHLVDQTGRLQYGVTIAVGGRDIRFVDQLQTPVPAGECLQVAVTLLV